MVAAGRRKRVFLAGCENARALDVEAASWGLNEFSLVEAAGRLCAECCVAALPDIFAGGAREMPGVLALAGSGNNAADALVMLRTLVVSGYADPACALALITKLPPEDEVSPLANAVKSLQSMDIPVVVWDVRDADLLGGPDLIIDGITGTGLKGPLAGKALEMVEAATRLREMGVQTPVAAIDVPSGIFDGWKPGMPVLEADITLAVEPRKLCLYNLAARPFAGRIVPVENIFPQVLIERYGEAELLDWEKCAARILKIKSSAYKYERGLVEIHAGCEGAAGAACLAARGA
ncbi:MAG TPA: hypothetical protein DEQ14_07260, partial [Treponema sp.]|nr:hypothetical protein [Treponema sp.]